MRFEQSSRIFISKVLLLVKTGYCADVCDAVDGKLQINGVIRAWNIIT